MLKLEIHRTPSGDSFFDVLRITTDQQGELNNFGVPEADAANGLGRMRFQVYKVTPPQVRAMITSLEKWLVDHA